MRCSATVVELRRVGNTAGVRRSFTFEGHRFALGRGVFDPVRHLSGVALANQLADVVAEHAPDGRSALDLGTGCGLLAASLARHGLRVVATDVSAGAVRYATANCAGIDVDVRHGDMFAPVMGEQFDLVVVNPPYERVEASRRQREAFTSEDFLERFGAQVHDFAPVAVLGFPVDQREVLEATGLVFDLWRTVATSGRDLGVFVAAATV